MSVCGIDPKRKAGFRLERAAGKFGFRRANFPGSRVVLVLVIPPRPSPWPLSLTHMTTDRQADDPIGTTNEQTDLAVFDVIHPTDYTTKLSWFPCPSLGDCLGIPLGTWPRPVVPAWASDRGECGLIAPGDCPCRDWVPDFPPREGPGV